MGYDRTAFIYLMAGVWFGGAATIAVVVFVTTFILFPLGKPDWTSFIKGAVSIPIMLVVIITMIGGLIWWSRK